ncbi:HTH-type transcriptional regulator GltR [compost metagenome]
MALDAQPVFEEELLLVLPADHPPVTGPADVQVRGLAGFAEGCTYRQIAENWLSVEGRPPAKVQQVGSYHAILACVAAGSCVGILPRSVLDLLREPPRLRQVPLMRVETLLVWRQGYATAAFEALREVLAGAG